MQVSLTQHGDRGPGGADGHGEDGAGVLALVGQLHVVDGDGELGGRGAVQLDTVVSERWRTEDGGEGQKTVRRLHSFNYSQRHRSFWSTVISAFFFFPLF